MPLTDVEAWARAVQIAEVVRRIDPAASNPYFRTNAAGFRSAVVSITEREYPAVVALGREAGQSPVA